MIGPEADTEVEEMSPIIAELDIKVVECFGNSSTNFIFQPAREQAPARKASRKFSFLSGKVSMMEEELVEQEDAIILEVEGRAIPIREETLTQYSRYGEILAILTLT